MDSLPPHPSADPLSPSTLGASVTKPGTALLYANGSSADSSPLVRSMTAGGWSCVVTHDQERARWLASVRDFRLIVILGGSPSWCHGAVTTLRSATIAPLLVLSPTLDELQAKLLDLGADMVIDSSATEGVWRAATRAMIRRNPSSAPALRYLDADELRLDLASRTAVVDASPVDLSPIEFDVLNYLMAHAQVVLRHHTIIKAVWNWKYTDERNALRIHINRLRHKLSDPSDSPRFIRSLRGVGYCFIKPVSEIAEDRSARNETERDETNVLLGGLLRKFSRLLLTADSRESACSCLVSAVVDEGLSDAAAVMAYRHGSHALHLVAQAGMSAEWEQAIAGGVPLSRQFLASETFNSSQARNYIDISKLSDRYGPTVKLLRAAGLPVILSVPLMDRHGTWGQLGFSRRPDSAFTPAACLVLESVGYLLGATFGGDSVLRAA